MYFVEDAFMHHEISLLFNEELYNDSRHVGELGSYSSWPFRSSINEALRMKFPPTTPQSWARVTRHRGQKRGFESYKQTKAQGKINEGRLDPRREHVLTGISFELGLMRLDWVFSWGGCHVSWLRNYILLDRLDINKIIKGW